MFLLILLLFLTCFMNTSLNLTLANFFASCGQYSVDMLQMRLLYRTHKNSAPLDVRISSENDFHGPFGMISIGFFVNNNDSVQCVAVKFMRGYGGNRILMKTRDIMAQIQDKLPKSERQHIIELFDTGNALRYSEDIMIMELGIETFHDRLYKRIVSYKNDDDMKHVIRALTVPIKEIHQVAIHMKINPHNYLYVISSPNGDGEQSLKLKHFDNAKIIHSNDKNERYLFEIDALDAFSSSFNVEYTGPEHYEQEKEISTKFDIWSLGMIIFEIHIDQLRSAEGKSPLTELRKGAQLRELGDLYLGFDRNHTFEFIGLNNKEAIFTSSSWIKHYKKAIRIILQLWHKFPRTALLVTNLLHNQRELRLTARGILDYLDGLCQLDELVPIQSAKALRMFSTMTIGTFKRQLNKTLRLNRINLFRTENREMLLKYGQMRATVRAIIKAQQQHIDEARRGQSVMMQICDKD